MPVTILAKNFNGVSFPSNLQNYYKLDGNGTDEIGNEDLIFNGGSYESGKVGQARRFIGKGQNAYTQNDVLTNAGSGFSMMGWVYVYGAGDNSFNRYIDLQKTTNFGDGGATLYWDADDTEYGFSLFDTFNTTTLALNTDIPQNQYVHLAGVFDPNATNNVRFFVNGVLEITGNNPTFENQVNNLSLSLGDNYFQASPSLSAGMAEDHVNAAIDEVRIYNGALTDQQVTDVYNLHA